MRLDELGELGLIRALRDLVKRRNPEVLVGIGDDGCCLADGTVLTTDAFVEGVHFDLSYMSLHQVGGRALSATLSDLAAMAAEPICALVALLLPSQLTDRKIRELYQGMEEVAESFGLELSGGEVSSSPVFGLVITVMGRASRPVLRSGARPDDRVYLTGYPGLAETGRAAIKQELDRSSFSEAIQRHLSPVPRVKEALSLAPSIHALIDLSDGLSTDAFHLAEESRVKIKIFWDGLPIHHQVRGLSERLHIPLKDLVLNSGEDFELLCTSSRSLPDEVHGLRLTKIGIVEEGEGVWLTEGGREEPIRPQGYEHLRGEPEG